MNLIEQLGWYEKAKEALHQLKSEKKDLISCGASVFVESQVIDALLEYRRQHNIFEVGDLCKISTKHDYGLYKFLRMRDDRIYLEDRLGFAEFGIAASAVSHADPEEIEAGKRLGVS